MKNIIGKWILASMLMVSPAGRSEPVSKPYIPASDSISDLVNCVYVPTTDMTGSNLSGVPRDSIVAALKDAEANMKKYNDSRLEDSLYIEKCKQNAGKDITQNIGGYLLADGYNASIDAIHNSQRSNL